MYSILVTLFILTLPPAATPIPVRAVKPTAKDVTLSLESIGTLQPSASFELYPTADGTISELFIHQGQWIEEKGPLFVIDKKASTLKLEEAKSEVAMNEAICNSLQKKVDRFLSLHDKEMVSKSEWDLLYLEVAKAQATLEMSKGRLTKAQLDLEDCTFLTPIAGRVGKLDIYPGYSISKSQNKPLVTIQKLDPLLVEFTMTEKEFSLFPKETGQMKIVSLTDPKTTTTGIITFFDNQFDAKTGLILVRGTVFNSTTQFRPGQAVRVIVPTVTFENALLIPQKTVKYNQEGPYVYIVLPDDTVTLRPVKLGVEEENEVVVLEGVEPNELVITEGHLRLCPGKSVELKP